MKFGWRRRAMAIVMVVGVVIPFALEINPAGAFPAGDPVFPFAYNISVTTHIQKLNQTMVVNGGTFVGGIDLQTGDLEGNLTLPKVSFTFAEAGVGLLDVTAQIVPLGPVTGTVDLYHIPNLTITATSVFHIRLIDVHVHGTTLNLVGNLCRTKTPASVTMSALANLGGATTMSGTFTIPDFQYCGTVVTTTAINTGIAGPNNTFSATATPQ